MAQTISIEEEDFRIAENRHDEIVKSLKAVTAALLKQDDKEIISAIKGQPDVFKLAMEQVIKSIPKPEVNVSFDYEKLVTLIRGICKDTEDKVEASTNNCINAINNRLLPDTFTLVKGYGGITESVKVNYKEANKITIKK